jgi:Holliday junction DNA helicase RuvA
MIAYLEGRLLKKEEERILLLVNQIGYEILVPAIVMETLKTKALGDRLSLFIYYHQTDRQPKPVLIGFNSEIEKEFFQYFITVEAIGPLKAVKALNIPVSEIANAVESKDAGKLKDLKGIGARTAQKIIATLAGKMGKFALLREDRPEEQVSAENFSDQVFEVLVSQLGHKPSDAKQMIADAVKRNKDISSPEELFDEIYRGYNPQN